MAQAATKKLKDFEGLEVRAVGVEMPGAAGGLREAMKFDPVELHKGEEVYVVLRGVVKNIRIEPIVKDDLTGPQRRVHILIVSEAALIDPEYVEDHMAAQRAKIARAKEQEAGQDPLDGGAYTRFLLMSRKKLAATCKELQYNAGGTKEDLAQRLADGYAADPEAIEDALARVEKAEADK